MELYRRVDEVLHYLWDPIGVASEVGARDEYHSYLPLVFKLTLEAKGTEAISNYLLGVESERMGFDVTPEAKKKATEIAELLIEHREWIKEKQAEPSHSANPRNAGG